MLQRLDNVAGDTIDEKLSMALYNVKIDIQNEKYSKHYEKT
jgi:hypothetical protein